MNMSRNKTYISDEQLHPMELCIHRGIKVQVEGLDGEHISQMCRCPGSRSWRGGVRQNDWIWVKQHPGRCYGALNGRLPWQLQRLFRIKLLNEDGAFIEFWSALALTTIHEHAGNLNPVSKYEQAGKALAAVDLQVFREGNIVSCAHVIPEIATSSKTVDGRNERCTVNSHIDLLTSNYVYNEQSENYILHASRSNARRDFRSVNHHLVIPYI
jgi:hypothetical protein